MWNFVVTDSAGQTMTLPGGATVSPLTLSPAVLPPGTVGAAYSASLTPSGGTPAYTVRLASWSGLPPGLALSSAGTFSGTPLYGGMFYLAVVVTDSASPVHSMVRNYVLTIDNAAGEAPAISINPTSVQLTYTRTAPAPMPVALNIGATSGSLPFTAMVSGIPGAILSATSGTAPASLSLTFNTAVLTAGTYAGVIAVNAEQSANGETAIPIVLTVVEPPPCTYNLNPTGGSIAAGGGTGSFEVSAGSLCSWTATASEPSWITVTAGAGTGTGTVHYSVTPNGGLAARTGTISAGGQAYTITQFGSTCSLAVNPASVIATAAGGLATVNVSTSNAACTWTASGLNAAPASGTGSGAVTFTIPSTNSVSPPPLSATVQLTSGGTPAIFNVTQTGVACTVTLSASSASIGSAGGTGSVTVSTPAGCAYNTVSGPSWINVTSGGSGAGPAGVLAYTVTANSTTMSRSGTLSIGGEDYSITQDPTPCSVTVDASASGSPFGSGGGSGRLAVTANGSNCSWMASSPVSWAAVAPAFGVGNGTINVAVTSNASSTVARTANLTVAGQTVALTQGGTVCTYALGSTTAGMPYGGGTGAVTVAAPAACGWTSLPDDSAPWLTITSSGSGGVSDVLFRASANPTSSPRAGTLTIAGLPYVVTQAAAPCSYTLSATSSPALAPGGATSSFTFTTTAAGCSATAVSYSSWLTATTASAPDGTSGTVNFTAALNPAGSTRTGTIQLAGQLYTVSQLGGTCAYSLSVYGVSFGKAGGPGTVRASQSAVGCTPVYGTDQPSIVELGTLAGPDSNIYTLPYDVAAYNATMRAIRRMTITFGGQVYTVKQTSW